MLRLFIKPFLDYCRSLCYAGKSIKELRRYIDAFNWQVTVHGRLKPIPTM